MEVSPVICGYSRPHSFPVGRIFCRENRTLAQPDIIHPHLATPAPTPDLSSLIDLYAPVWRRLNDSTFSSHEFVSLIEEMFTSEGGVEAIRGLRGDNAQTFADVVQKACSGPLFKPYDLIIPFLPGTFAFEPLRPLIRLWTSPIFRRNSGGSVWPLCGRCAPATFCFRDHSNSKSNLTTIHRRPRCTMVGRRTCGRVNTKAVWSQSRF